MENNVSSILEGLNPEQRKAVECVEGPVLIVAGAGSGKTRVLTCRIANILAQGCEPSRILALTFTKKAAGEMKERIAMMVGERKAKYLQMGTFHAVFVRFLREYAESLGYPKSFTIYDQSDSVSAIKTCIRELQLDDKIYKPKEVLSRISSAKNNLVTAEMYAANQNAIISDTKARKPRICDIYKLYKAKCKQAGVMDFDDILLNMNLLLRDNPEALESISARFSHILVDEYQDTNMCQYYILKKLARTHHNICVVGDDSQSIYAFRGARIENILNFKKDYPECRVFRLERNYRSTQTIVDAANSLIAKNSGRIPKTCFSEGPRGDRIKLIKAYTEQEEAILIVSDLLSKMRDNMAKYEDFAILYRTNAQSRAIEEALRRKNLPYMVYSGNSFFDRAEVKDMMAYFKLAVNPQDDESFKRVVNKPARGIGGTTMQAVMDAAVRDGISLFKAAQQVPKIQAFCEMINGFAMLAPTADANELAVKIADQSGLYSFYKSDTTIEGMARAANVEELLNSVAAYHEDCEEEGKECLLGNFLEDISLMSNVDSSENNEDAGNKIALMTVHSAKGLEFPFVYVAGMEENLFPSGGFTALPNEIEEERRLFYVAITRAEKDVVISFADSRMRNGKHEQNPPSRFIKEIDAKYFQNPLEFGFREPVSAPSRPAFRSDERPHFGKAEAIARPVPEKKIPDSEFNPTPMMELKAGQRVEHNRFGFGRIEEITGTAPELKARISFDEFGEKFIMLKYAKLRLAE